MALSGVNSNPSSIPSRELPLDTNRPGTTTPSNQNGSTITDSFENQRPKGQDPLNGAAPTLLAQANGNRTQDRQYDFTLPGVGNVRVTQSLVRDRNADGTTFDKLIFTVQRGGNGGQPISAETAGHLADELTEAANYLYQGGNLNGQPPRTVRIAFNESTGAGAIERWHGTDQPGSGRLGGLAVRTASGWAEVPRGILDQLPTNVATDVLRQGGTSLYRGTDSANQTYWSVQYKNPEGRLVSLTFDGQAQLARRSVELADGRRQTDFFPPWDNLRFRSNGVAVPDRGTSQYTENGAVVLNEKGDIRTEYRLKSTNPDQYEETRTIEHLYANGRSTDLRVVTDAKTQRQTLARVDGNGNLTELGALQQNPDGTRSLPLNEATRAFAGQQLTSASGVSLGVSTQEAGSASWSWSDTGHLVLDIAGLVPVIGEAADVANAVWYLGEGKFLEAGLSLISMVPAIGDLIGKGGKLAIKALPTPAIAKNLLEALAKIDLPKFIDNLRSHPQIGPHADNIGRALDEWMGSLQRLVARSELPATLAAKLDDTQLTNLLKGLDGAGITKLAGRLGDDVLARMASHLDGASVLKITDYFDHYGQIDSVRRMSTRGGAELLAANKAVDLEIAAGGHSLLRHGPDVDDPTLQRRLQTGIAGDGAFSAAPASTRFKSYQEWIDTREKALDEFLTREGFTRTTGPATAQRFPTVTVEHSRDLGEGFIGDASTASKTTYTDPTTGATRKGKVYSSWDSANGLSRTQSAFEWNGSEWIAKQHFPSAYNFDPKTSAYTAPP